MTIAPTPSSSMAIACPSMQNKMKRLSSLQDVRTSSSFSSGFPRRSSLTCVHKSKGPASMVVVIDKQSSIANDIYGFEKPMLLSRSEDTLQSADKRRRYQRRGSKTSFMIRGEGSLKVNDVPVHWRSSLAQCLRKFSTSQHASSPDDCSTESTLCTGVDSLSQSPSTSTRSSISNFERLSPLSEKPTILTNVSSPFFDRVSPRRQAAVTLLTSALELACIEDGGSLDPSLNQLLYRD